jgi:hypothetical protein
MTDIKLLKLESHIDRRGDINVIEELPFPVKRVFWIHNVPIKEIRGGHAHKVLKQILIAVNGAVCVRAGGTDYILDHSDAALYIPPNNMIRMTFLTEGTILLVLASHKYNQKDYIYETK